MCDIRVYARRARQNGRLPREQISTFGFGVDVICILFFYIIRFFNRILPVFTPCTFEFWFFDRYGSKEHYIKLRFSFVFYLHDFF